MLFPDKLMLLAFTSFSNISSQRTEIDPSMLRKSIGGKKLVVRKQLWTKPAAEYGLGKSGIQKTAGVKCTVTAKNISF